MKSLGSSPYALNDPVRERPETLKDPD